MPDRPGADGWLAVEAAAAGLAFGGLLEWASTALVGSFRPRYLADPYWRGVPWLRTDTSGFAAFIVAGVCLLSWPTEGTLRVTALLLSTVSFGLFRYLRPAVVAGRASPASAWPGQSR